MKQVPARISMPWPRIPGMRRVGRPQKRAGETRASKLVLEALRTAPYNTWLFADIEAKVREEHRDMAPGTAKGAIRRGLAELVGAYEVLEIGPGSHVLHTKPAAMYYATRHWFDLYYARCNSLRVDPHPSPDKFRKAIDELYLALFFQLVWIKETGKELATAWARRGPEDLFSLRFLPPDPVPGFRCPFCRLRLAAGSAGRGAVDHLVVHHRFTRQVVDQLYATGLRAEEELRRYVHRGFDQRDWGGEGGRMVLGFELEDPPPRMVKRIGYENRRAGLETYLDQVREKELGYWQMKLKQFGWTAVSSEPRFDVERLKGNLYGWIGTMTQAIGIPRRDKSAREIPITKAEYKRIDSAMRDAVKEAARLRKERKVIWKFPGEYQDSDE